MKKNDFYLVARSEDIITGLQAYVSGAVEYSDDLRYSLGYALKEDGEIKEYVWSDDVSMEIINALKLLPCIEVIEAYLLEQLTEDELEKE